MDAAQTVDRVTRALSRGRLRLDQLTARGLGSFLGKTTSVVYHHFGSLDGFLFAVSQRGYSELGERVRAVVAEGGKLDDVAETFVRFGLESPALYSLMFERRYDWTALRKSGAFDRQPLGLQLWAELCGFLKLSGSSDPDTDARMIMAGLHGLVSLAASGRANVGALAKSDREIAIACARTLVHRIRPAACQEEA